MQNSQITSKYGTGYIESEMVLAALAGDWEEVERLVKELFPGEARKLRRALTEINLNLEFQGRSDDSNNRR